jgi:hypothetical protein
MYDEDFVVAGHPAWLAPPSIHKNWFHDFRIVLDYKGHSKEISIL